jgi:hypothetical protein
MTEYDPIDVTLFDEDDDPESLAGKPCEDQNARDTDEERESDGN